MKKLEIKEVQRKVNEYFKRGKFKGWPKFVILARLEEEISEIGRIMSVEEGFRERWKIDNMNYEDEFGDALFQLVHLANGCDVDLDKSLKHVFAKYEKYIRKNE